MFYLTTLANTPDKLKEYYFLPHLFRQKIRRRFHNYNITPLLRLQFNQSPNCENKFLNCVQCTRIIASMSSLLCVILYYLQYKCTKYKGYAAWFELNLFPVNNCYRMCNLYPQFTHHKAGGVNRSP